MWSALFPWFSVCNWQRALETACMLLLVIVNGHVWWCMYMCLCACREREREPTQRGSGLPCSSTSGLYIKPLINPEWRPACDRLTGQAPVQDKAWFITSELQPALIYFRLRKGESRGGGFQGRQTQKQHCYTGKGDTEVESDWERCVTHWLGVKTRGGVAFVMFSFKCRLCILLEFLSFTFAQQSRVEERESGEGRMWWRKAQRDYES